jgi:hypothetical protein
MRKWSAVLVFCFALVAGNAFADNVLDNPGFETGALSPWFNSTDFCGGCTWSVTSEDAHGGSFSAATNPIGNAGNRLIEQDFAAIATSMITEASLWLKMPDTGIAAVFFRYSDSTTEENIVTVTNLWTQFNMTAFLDPGKSLVGFGVFGCTNCPGSSRTFADDFVVNAVPEPASLALLGSGLLGIAGIARRRFLKI